MIPRANFNDMRNDLLHSDQINLMDPRMIDIVNKACYDILCNDNLFNTLNRESISVADWNVAMHARFKCNAVYPRYNLLTKDVTQMKYEKNVLFRDISILELLCCVVLERAIASFNGFSGSNESIGTPTKLPVLELP